MGNGGVLENDDDDGDKKEEDKRNNSGAEEARLLVPLGRLPLLVTHLHLRVGTASAAAPTCL